MISRCESASTRANCTISASAPTSEICCASSRDWITSTEFVLLCRPEDREGLTTLGENFRPVAETAGNYSVSEQLRVPLALRREGVSLFHAPHYVLPPLVPCRSVVTIHDCIHLMFPQYLPNRAALAYARASIRMAARRATRVHDRVGKLQAGHPALRGHRTGEDRRHLQRVRRALWRRAAPKRTLCACANVFSCTTTSSCTRAT